MLEKYGRIKRNQTESCSINIRKISLSPERKKKKDRQENGENLNHRIPRENPKFQKKETLKKHRKTAKEI